MEVAVASTCFRRPTRRATLLLVPALLLLSACSQSPQADVRGDGADPLAVRIHPVQEQLLRRPVQAVGSLYALEESTLSAEVDGRVEKVLADVGDEVKQGQMLVTLATADLQLELERQRAIVGQVRARLGLSPDAPLPRDPSQVAFVQRAAAQLFEAEQRFQRAQQLRDDGLISQEQYDEAGARYKSARAAHDEAIQEVEQLKAQLQAGEAARDLAANKLDHAFIRAPFPGAIKSRRVSPGEFLRVQSPVIVIVRADQLRARLAVPEKYSGSLRTGASVDVRVEAYPNEVFQGRLLRINPAVNPESRSFEAEALLPNADGRLRPGFFVQASIPSELEQEVLTVPEQAVQYRYGIYKVFVVGDGKVEEREIKIGARQDDRVEVVEGLQAADRVAEAVQGELFHGARIRETAE